MLVRRFPRCPPCGGNGQPRWRSDKSSKIGVKGNRNAARENGRTGEAAPRRPGGGLPCSASGLAVPTFPYHYNRG